MNLWFLIWCPYDNFLQEVWCEILKMQNKERELFFFFPLQEGRLLKEGKKNFTTYLQIIPILSSKKGMV